MRVPIRRLTVVTSLRPFIPASAFGSRSLVPLPMQRRVRSLGNEQNAGELASRGTVVLQNGNTIPSIRHEMNTPNVQVHARANVVVRPRAREAVVVHRVVSARLNIVLDQM